MVRQLTDIMCYVLFLSLCYERVKKNLEKHTVNLKPDVMPFAALQKMIVARQA